MILPNRGFRFAVSATVVLLLAAGSRLSLRVQAQPAASPSTPAGRDLYFDNCASCHGSSARGDGPVAESLRARPADLTQFAMKNGGVFPTARLERIIDGRDVRAHGTREMPVWGTAFKRTKERLDDPAVRARIDAIVRYLAGLQERAG